MSYTYKNCYNCKYHHPEMYDDSKCKSPVFFEFEYDGTIDKKYAYAKNIRPKNIDEPCEYFSEGLIFKIKKFIGRIQMWWYKKKYPEKLI